METDRATGNGEDRLVLITFAVDEAQRSMFANALGELTTVAVLPDLSGEERAAALASAEALLVWGWRRELSEEDPAALRSVRFVQLITAGADGVPLDEVPGDAVIASNVGAYAEPMAEHVMAMTLALAKHLLPRYQEMARGEFNQFRFNRSLEGAVCGILGYGGIGQRTAGFMRSFGARIHAVNTSGRVDDGEVEWMGTLDDLDMVLQASDVLVIALPLTRSTRGLIGRRELGLMKPNAILVNVARGDIVDQDALYEHLVSHPDFQAGIDAWWVEPLTHGEFRTDHPFFDLTNVLGSPHNSGLVPGVIETAARRAAENVARYLRVEPIKGVVDRDDYRG